uniref:G-protein coupled receptors family 1 profile domain-containing protein n=1 Tax=Acrobeloides nanus TaxID=290746 RepID=A0A914DVK2_9BILA
MFFSSTMIITILVGIDRLLTVLFPHKEVFNTYNKIKYLIGMSIIPMGYSATWAITSYNYMAIAGDTQVICTLDQFVTGDLRVPKNYINICLSIFMLSTYASIWIFLRLKKVGSSFTRRVIKALTIIMLIQVLAWPVSMGIFTISQKILPPSKFLVVGIYLENL